MKNAILFLLLVTSVYFGFMWKQTHDQLAVASANNITDRERADFGPVCVDWIEAAERKKSIIGQYSLKRSWKKHGQLVFEVETRTDQENTTLCLYDEQSGVVILPAESERSNWMFY